MRPHSIQNTVPSRRQYLLIATLVTTLVALALSGCSTISTLPPDPVLKSQPAGSGQTILGRNDHYVVLLAAKNDSWPSLAEQFYGDPGLYWRIEDANYDVTLKAGQEVVVPLKDSSRLGVEAHSVHAVSILAYHSFGDGKGRLTISREQLENQMQYLLTNNYRVITLDHFFDFLAGKRSIPKRAVMITIDDGHPSTYEIAFPVLKRYGFAATVFPYSDYIGQGGLTWAQLREMQASGLIEVQLHSVTHSDLTQRLPYETLPQMRKRLAREISAPKALFGEHLESQPYVLAYPYGAANQYVVEEVQRANLAAGFTVSRGGNAFFSYPYALQRNQIYRDDTMESFGRKLTTSIQLDPL